MKKYISVIIILACIILLTIGNIVNADSILNHSTLVGLAGDSEDMKKFVELDVNDLLNKKITDSTGNESIVDYKNGICMKHGASDRNSSTQHTCVNVVDIATTLNKGEFEITYDGTTTKKVTSDNVKRLIAAVYANDHHGEKKDTYSEYKEKIVDYFSACLEEDGGINKKKINSYFRNPENSDVNENNQAFKDAFNEALDITSNVAFKVRTKDAEDCGNSVWGPYKLTAGKIDSVKIGDSSVTVAKKQNGTFDTKYEKIAEGDTFYINVGSKTGSVKVEFKGKVAEVKVRLAFFTKLQATAQQIMVVKSLTSTKTLSVTHTIDKYKFRVEKIDKDTGKALEGVKFIVMDNSKKYIKASADGNNIYTYTGTTDNKNNATKFVTGSNGRFTLRGLPSKTHTIIETDFLKGYIEQLYCGGNKCNNNSIDVCAINQSDDFKTDDIIELQNKKPGLRIIKKDINNSSARIANAKFNLLDSSNNPIKFKLVDGTYVVNPNGSAALVTDSNGEIYINELDVGKTYSIKEVEPAPGYKKGLWIYKDGKFEKVDTYKIKVEDKGLYTVNMYNTSKELRILKKDLSNNNNIKGVELILYKYNKQTKVLSLVEFKKSNSGNYVYVDKKDEDKSSSDVLTTGDNALVIRRLPKLPKNTVYVLKETKAADGYQKKLYDKDGNVPTYDNAKGEKINGIEIDWNPETAQNEETYVYAYNKASRLVSISGFVWEDLSAQKNLGYDSVFGGVDKKLAGVTVNLLKKGKTKVEATTKTNKNGKYEFKEIIPQSDLDDYYVQFDYSSFTGKESNAKYSPVAYLAGNKTISSRAIYASDKDAKAVKQVAVTYDANNETHELKYGLSNSDLYNSTTDYVENINLGIRKIPTEAIAIKENIDYVTVSINGYTYKYYYGERGNVIQNVPTVNWQGKEIAKYSRKIYPTDISYSANATPSNKLDIKVTYRIDITNPSEEKLLYVDGKNELFYQEKQAVIKSLTNDYDTSRYDLADSNWTGSNGSITYNKITNTNTLKLASKKTSTCYVTFKVKDDAIKKISEKGITEVKPTIVSVNGYHEYQKDDYSWDYLDELIQRNTHNSNNVAAKDYAPFLSLELGNERKVSGKVFEDIRVTENGGDALGNGYYDNSEKLIEGVKVELLNNDKSIAKLYTKDNQNGTLANNVQTDKDGKYEFNGVIPGNYIIRFTYGNGETYTIKDYKSTIVTDENAKNAIKNSSSNGEWYKDVSDDHDYSVAVDDLEVRENYNKSNNAVNEMTAYTPLANITIENTKGENVVNITEGNDGNKYVFNKFNFGIIKAPEQKLDIEKAITNVKLVNGQNNVVFNGNPRTDTMSGVTSLNPAKYIDNGSIYTRMELDNDIIYGGSTLSLDYDILIKNISDIDYQDNDNTHEGWYYMFGDKTYATPVKIDVNQVVDTLNESLKANNSIVLDGSTVNANEGVITINDKKTLERNGKAEFKLRVIKKIETDDTLDYINNAKVTNATSTSKYSRKVILPEEVKAEAVITPPTGEDRQSMIIYTIVGAISLVIIAGGIVVIKKKVL